MVKYPFLPHVKNHIAELDLHVQDLASSPKIRERAKKRLSTAFQIAAALSHEASKDFETEIASYALAIIYVAGIGDPKLAERFALLEAQQIKEYLKRETRKDVILEVAYAFKWEIRNNEDLSVSIRFTKYLQNTTRGRLFHNPEWKLANRVLEKGWVRISPYEIARLLQEEVQNRIEDSTKQELPKLPLEVQKDIEELKIEFLKRKPQFEEFDQVIKAQESEYPPCISSLMKRTAQGQHLSHVERFTLVTYLLHQGISVDTIVSLFSNVSDFKEDKTRYQVEHLAGQRWGRTKPYVTYNCSTLQTHNVCLGPVDPICESIRNPLTYHLKKKGRPKITDHTRHVSRRSIGKNRV